MAGFGLFFASSIAFEISSKLFPSITSKVSHPKASYLFNTSSAKARSVEPSIVILLESYKTINFFKFNVPASDEASLDIPSIRHPSPTKA